MFRYFASTLPFPQCTHLAQPPQNRQDLKLLALGCSLPGEVYGTRGQVARVGQIDRCSSDPLRVCVHPHSLCAQGGSKEQVTSVGGKRHTQQTPCVPLPWSAEIETGPFCSHTPSSRTTGREQEVGDSETMLRCSDDAGLVPVTKGPVCTSTKESACFHCAPAPTCTPASPFVRSPRSFSSCGVSPAYRS